MRWKPNVTVAAVIEQAGRFLLVEEASGGELKLNQPAGHLERGESLTAAVAREAVEETAHEFAPEALVGIYHWQAPEQDITYLRFAFCGAPGTHHEKRALDKGIVRTVWMTRDEIAASRERHRSPYVLACVDDYLAGRRIPLNLVRSYGDLA